MTGESERPRREGEGETREDSEESPVVGGHVHNPVSVGAVVGNHLAGASAPPENRGVLE